MKNRVPLNLGQLYDTVQRWAWQYYWGRFFIIFAILAAIVAFGGGLLGAIWVMGYLGKIHWTLGLLWAIFVLSTIFAATSAPNSKTESSEEGRPTSPRPQLPVRK